MLQTYKNSKGYLIPTQLSISQCVNSDDVIEYLYQIGYVRGVIVQSKSKCVINTILDDSDTNTSKKMKFGQFVYVIVYQLINNFYPLDHIILQKIYSLNPHPILVNKKQSIVNKNINVRFAV